jgi:hypothetical protein
MRLGGPASTRPATAGSTPRPRRSATRLPRIRGATDSSRPPEVWLPVFLEPEDPLLVVPLRRTRPVPPGSLFGEDCLMHVTLLREKASHRRLPAIWSPPAVPQRPPPGPFTPSPASAPARSGFGSKESGQYTAAGLRPEQPEDDVTRGAALTRVPGRLGPCARRDPPAVLGPAGRANGTLHHMPATPTRLGGEPRSFQLRPGRHESTSSRAALSTNGTSVDPGSARSQAVLGPSRTSEQ